MPKTTHQFSIPDMHCASCVNTIEKALIQLPGITSAQVNFASKSATVTGEASHEKIITAIKQCGYDARLADAEDQDDDVIQASKTYRKLIAKTIVALIIGVPLMLELFFPWMPSLQRNYIQWPWVVVSFITLLVLIFSGGQIYRSAWKAFLHHQANMDTLIALGTGAAWLYSTLVVLLPMWIPAIARHVYFDIAAILLGFINFGAALEIRARGKTSQAIKKLMGLRPKTAMVIRQGQPVEVSIEDIQVGDIIQIRPGEKIAVDGVITEGNSEIDESMLTGEPMPVHKKINDAVVAGTINKMGSFLFKATRVGKETALARIIALVKQAQNTKPKIGRIVDKISAIFVPIVIILAIITAMLWYDFGPTPKAAFVLVTTIAVLVIACPCALGLATPISIIVGIGKAAEKGILIRNGDALQTAAKLDTIVLDKTGTITEGKPALTQIIPLNQNNPEEILKLAASVESHSEHALGQAVVSAAREKQLKLLPINDFMAIAGHGVQAKINDQEILIGNKKLMRDNGVDINAINTVHIETFNTPLFFAINKKLSAVLTIADPIKSDAKDAIAKMQQMGLQVIMLTGDNSITAAAVAKAVGVDKFIAEVLPAEKAEQIKQLQAKGNLVAMVGDGINDAPALSAAHIGFAIGTGTDVAIESGDVTLMRGSLMQIPNTIMISRATIKNIKQNLWGAFLYNALGIPIAAGVFYPLVGLLLNPMIAGAAMALSSVTVVANANRLRIGSIKNDLFI